MTKTFLFHLISILLILSSCNSVQHFNKKFQKPVSPKKLKADVKFIHNKLTKLHPHLYDYISKKELDFKFDSLCYSLNKPLTRSEFYLKLSPIISSIKQGHTFIYMPKKRFTKEEISIFNTTQGLTPISNLEFDFQNNKLFIIKNHSNDTTLKIGSEIILIDSTKPSSIILNYSKTISNDGYIKTYTKEHFKDNFLAYYYLETGLKDSLKIKLAYKNDTIEKTISRCITNQKNYFEKFTIFEHYTNEYKKNVTLDFLDKDSSIALLKINSFSNFSFDQYFLNINSHNVRNLIIDLRGNPGGIIHSSSKLFSYFIDSTKNYIFPYEITSRTSLIHTRKFINKHFIGKFFHLVFLPIRVIKYGTQFFYIRKKGNRYLYYSPILNVEKTSPSENYSYKGEIYIITNGETYSSACLFSSQMKANQLATFVGEETGGASNGSNAGFMVNIKLPNSKLITHFGLMYIEPTCSFDTIGRGIMPDVEIIPTLEDRINDCDPELDWILNDIQNNQLDGKT